MLPRSLRGRLTTVVGIGATVLVVVLVAGFNVVLRNGLGRDANALLRARASAALASVSVAGRHVHVREAPGDEAIDRQLWVYSGTKEVESPPGPAASAATAAAQAARSPGTFKDAAALDLRLYGVPIEKHGRRLGAVVAGVSLAPYENTARRALIASLVLGAFVLLGMLVAVRTAILAALRPVDRMTADAAAWSVDDLDHRFRDAGPHDELSRLAATFNDLLGRLSASFRHEQRFSAEISHELRTPLAKLVTETELALRRERSGSEYRAALEAVALDAKQMQRVIETLVAVARSQFDPRSGTADAETVVDAVLGALPSGVDVRVVPGPRRARLGVDDDVAERVLAPVVANAVKHAGSAAAIAIEADAATVNFVVTDDGPGVPLELREAIFAPGFRAAPGQNGQAGAGLGLALARRLARAAGGDVRCDRADSGSRFVVTLPAA